MTAKKLLVLDVNGLLIDTYFHKEPLPEESPDARVGNFFVYKRPFCEEFLQFCLDNFIVGIWSSAREYNVNNLVEYVFGDAKERLAFSWHQSDCTDVGLKAPDNQWKPLFMKELSKLWRKVKVELPWCEGDYGPSNTLLVDDTPYKAVLNPPNTAIFPRSYTARDHGDTFLGGALRNYLEGIRDSASVQTYVENNPFGEPSITPESPLWSHISKVLLRVQNVLNEVTEEIAQVLPNEDVSADLSRGGRRRRSRFRKWTGFSDPLQQTNDDTRSFVDFPSEAIELHTDENTVHQAHEVDLSEKEIVVLSGPLEVDVEQTKNEHSGRESSHVNSGRNDEDDRMIRGASQSCQEEVQGTVEGANRTLEGQASIAVQTFSNSGQAQSNASAGIDVGLCDRPEQWGDEVDDQGKEEMGQQVCDDSKNKELITPRDNNFARTSNSWQAPLDSSTCSDGSRFKHRRFYGHPSESHYKRKYSSRDSSDYNQTWKRQKGFYRDNNSIDYNQTWRRQNRFYRDNNRHHSDYDPNWKGQRGWYVDNNNDSFDYSHNWKRQRQGGTTNMLPCSGRADKGYANRDSSFSSSYVRPPQQRHSNKSVDVRSEYTWGAPMVSATRNAVLDCDFSAKPYQSSGGSHVSTTNSNVYGRTQDGVPASDQWHQGLEPNALKEGSRVWPERTEDWSMKSWHIDCANRESGPEPYRDVGAKPYQSSRGFHVSTANSNVYGHNQDGAPSSDQWHQGSKPNKGSSAWPERTEDWSANSWHIDCANREGGASSQPYRDVGASSRPYRKGIGASRPRHQSIGASMQQHHSYSNRRKGW